ncbi:hypothetical protein ACWOE3_10195 [Enterococcus dispar]|uniref:Uncharacterized protein n=1 Tax=Enterococcus dispar ATCC 51266 TaxID=1139219 RepID=S0KP06_9ENTE|nr:hypothetical protein [Enterococcus dispar]EOT42755.1 hypothetical protein OMK_01116 [Enterococcus dispar ATCC 51266]EOW84794.1 hypothetical protein I569_00083 [Enterococcus dispar ATCC 51266]
MEEKNVYSIDPATLGQKKTVAANYKINTLYETEVEPPANYLILAWDNKTRSWYDAGANVDGQLKPILGMVSQLIKQNVEYEKRFARLEEFHKIDTPLEGSSENVSE